MELNVMLVLLQLLFVALSPSQVQSESDQPSTTPRTVGDKSTRKPQINATATPLNVNNTTPDNTTTSGNNTTTGSTTTSWNRTAENMTIMPDNTTIYDSTTLHNNTMYHTSSVLANTSNSVNISTTTPTINATTTLHPYSNKSTTANTTTTTTTTISDTSTLFVTNTEQDTNSSVTSATVFESSQTSIPGRITMPIQNQTNSTQQDVMLTTSVTVSGISSGDNIESMHSKSGRSLALGITIPLLIVLVVIGAIWIRRRFKKVPKSGTGYLTLEEEAHSFGSIQSPTYDLDL